MGGLLHDPVADARDSQVPDPAGGLGNVYPARWRRMVHPLLQFPPKVGEEDCDAPFFDGLNSLAVDSGGPSRRARLGGPIQRPLELSSASACIGTRGVVG